MKSAGIPRSKMYNVALVHVRTGCTEQEIKNIVRLKNSSVPIGRWVSYVEPAYMGRVEPFSPEKAERHPFDLNRSEEGYDIIPALLGDRFILCGEMLWLHYIFQRIFRVNLARFTPLQFHSSLDTIGARSAAIFSEKTKQRYLSSSSSEFCQFLEAYQLERGYSLSISFDNSALLWIRGREKQPLISFNWYSTLDNMFEFIKQADEKKEG